jgi:hypothetical protein
MIWRCENGGLKVKKKVFLFLSGVLFGAVTYFASGIFFEGESKWIPLWGICFLVVPFFIFWAYKDGRDRKKGTKSSFVQKTESLFLVSLGWISFFVFLLKLLHKG